MKKNSIKIITIMVAMLVCFFAFNSVWAAAGAPAGGGGGGNEAGIDPTKGGIGNAKDAFGDTANNITGLVQFVGYAFAIGMLIYLGIKYVSASADGKADLKKGAINYVIGAIVIVAAVNIFKLIATFGEKITEGGTSSVTEIEVNMRYA